MEREEVVQIVKSAREAGKKPDLSKMYLFGMNLSGIDLGGADLSLVNLRLVDLSLANLHGVLLPKFYESSHPALTRFVEGCSASTSRKATRPL